MRAWRARLNGTYRRALGPWLRASGRDGRVVSLVGLVLVVVALAVMAVVFRVAGG